MAEVVITNFVVNPFLEDQVGEQLVKPLITDLADEARAHAERSVPVDTGALAASLVAVVTGTGRDVMAEVQANTSYAAYVEYGTDDTPPQPYLRPALIVIRGRLGAG